MALLWAMKIWSHAPCVLETRPGAKPEHGLRPSSLPGLACLGLKSPVLQQGHLRP